MSDALRFMPAPPTASFSDMRTELHALRRADREADTAEEDRRVAEIEAEQQRAREARDARLQDAAAMVEDCEPPDDAELKAETSSLPPQRGRLVPFCAWRASLAKRLADLESGRTNFLEQIGAPAVTQAQLDELVAADRSNFLGWLRSGGDALAKPMIREFEHARLRERLAGDTLTAQIAREALGQAEEEIDALQAQIAALDRRHKSFVHDVAIEEAEAVGARYTQQARELEATLSKLLGLAANVGTRGDYHRTYKTSLATEVDLPFFNLDAIRGAPRNIHRHGRPLHQIAVSSEQVTAEATVWQKMIDGLMANPMAGLDAPDGATLNPEIEEH
jgi:hypothetical protein